MKFPILAYLISLLSVSFAASARENTEVFEQSACEDWREAFGFAFRDESGAMRLISFLDKDRTFALTWPTGEGTLKWDDVVAIHVVPSQPNNGQYPMTIEYRDNITHRIRILEAGLIDSSCFASLHKRYGTSFKFTSEKPTRDL